MAWIVRVGLVAALLLSTTHASAGDERASNVELSGERFREGRELWEKGSYLEACAKFEESHQLARSVGNLLNLGRCAERGGQLATAHRRYLESAKLAASLGEDDREQVARQLADAVAPRVATVTLDIQPQPEGLEVRIDDRLLEAAELAEPVPIDLGKHRVSVRAPGFLDAETVVTVAGEAERLEAKLSLEAIPPDPTGPGTPTPADWPGDVGIAGFVIGGVGIAGLVAGAVLGGIALGKRNAAEKHCTEASGEFACTQAGVDKIDSAKKQATASTIAFIAGGVLAATGLVLVIVDANSTETAEVALRVGIDGAGASLSVPW